MNRCFTPEAWDDYLYWENTDKAILRKINKLIEDICRDPYTGIGKPEPLKGDLSGCWSRRIFGEHRCVYIVQKGVITFLQFRYHY